MVGRTSCLLAALLLLLLLLPACSPSDGDRTGGGGGDGGEGEGEGEGEEEASMIPDFAPFQVVFYYPRGDDKPETDLYVTQEFITPGAAREWQEQGTVPAKDREAFLFAMTRNREAGEDGESILNCASCFVSTNGKYLAWAEVEPGTGEQELWVAPIHPGWQVRFDLKHKATSAGGQGRLDTRSLGFAGDWLVYGVITGDHEVVMAQKAEDGAEEHVVQDLPLGGGFRVDPEGRAVVSFEIKTLASMTAWSASPSGEANPILLHLFEVENASTGSDYSGNEPASVSPDGRFVAVVTTARERLGVQAELRLHVLTLDPLDPGSAHISSMSLGPAGQGACLVPRDPGQFVQVDRPPIWAPDGRYLYVLGRAPAHCGAKSYDVDDTAILRADVADNGELGTLTNLTPIPPDWGEYTRRPSFGEFALSPDGKMFIVTTTSWARVRGTDLFLMSARVNEVYTELLTENQDTTLFATMVRLTSLSKHHARNPLIFAAR